MPTVGRHGTPLPRPAHRHSGLVHQPPGFIPTDRKAVVLELLGHAATAIAVARLLRNRFHLRDHGHLVTINRWRRTALHVGVESAAAHVEYLTEHGDWPCVVGLCHKGIFHLGSFTKKRMAFLRNSFHRDGLLECVAEFFRPAAEPLEHALPILFLIVRGPRVLVGHPIP